MDDTARTFGDCTKCYGKGYSTVIEYAESRYARNQLPIMRYCDCDRGKQLEQLIHKQLASLGGHARAQKLTPEQRSAIATKGGKAGGRSRGKRDQNKS